MIAAAKTSFAKGDRVRVTARGATALRGRTGTIAFASPLTLVGANDYCVRVVLDGERDRTTTRLFRPCDLEKTF